MSLEEKYPTKAFFIATARKSGWSDEAIETMINSSPVPRMNDEQMRWPNIPPWIEKEMKSE